MSAFLPDTLYTFCSVVGLCLAVFALGFFATFLASQAPKRILLWSSFPGGLVVIERLTDNAPAGFRMLALSSFSLIALKGIVHAEYISQGETPLKFAQWTGFALGWFGMRPRIFATSNAGAFPHTAKPLALLGVRNTAIGLVFLGFARQLYVIGQGRWVGAIFLLTGISLVLHFGVCNLVAAAWRRQGVDCGAIFVAPLRSQTLGEFWSRRWNLAFSEMTAALVYRPLRRRFGPGLALLAAFLFSGLLHEMAISLPVRAGFGGPLFYFILHGALVLLERSWRPMRKVLSGWIGRIWTLFWLMLPLPLLFHQTFLREVLWALVYYRP